MKKLPILFLIAIVSSGCSTNQIKDVVVPLTPASSTDFNAASASSPLNNGSGAKAPTSKATKYTIFSGEHYCSPNPFKPVTVSQMKFSAKFDRSAVYDLGNVNQFDINKLYGFSEGLQHQYNSARMGWAYYDGLLRLFAYAYNNGTRESQEITTVSMGVENICTIAVSGNTYVFTVNGITVTLPRAASTSETSGYQLYPYFGGDEVAPHNIYIWIKGL